MLFDRGGLSWFGGLAGGIAAGGVAVWRRRLGFMRVFSAAAVAMAGALLISMRLTAAPPS